MPPPAKPSPLHIPLSAAVFLGALLACTVPGFAVQSLPSQSVAYVPQPEASLNPPVENPVAKTDDKERCVLPSASLSIEGWHAAAGATRIHSWNALLDLGLEVKLGKQASSSRSSVLAEVICVRSSPSNEPLSERLGAFNPPSSLVAEDAFRVFNLYYRRSWNDDALVLKTGQIAIDDDFMLSESAGLFSYSAFAAMPSQIGTARCSQAGSSAAFPEYAVAAPGIFVSKRASPGFAWSAGLYYGAPGADESDNHGFSWEHGSGAGAVLFTELAWRTDRPGVASTFLIGATGHSGRFDNFEAIDAGDSSASIRGLYSLYVSHDLTLLRDSRGNALFEAFWRAGFSPQRDRSAVTSFGGAGLTWRMPWAGRPEDRAGLGVSHTRFGKAFRNVAGRAPAETAVELTYEVALLENLSVQADIQRLFGLSPAESGGCGNATVFGLRTTVEF